MNQEKALKDWKKRKDNPPKRIDNSTLYAGSPMTYYCHSCGDIAAVLPEDHMGPPPRLCDKCQEMKDEGILPEK